MKSTKPKPTKTPKQEIDTKKPDNKPIIINSLLIGLVIGLVIFALFRFITYKPMEHTHYHANWSVSINGQQQTFAEPTFYQEVATCSTNDDTNPLHRAHMHDNVYDVIHVHADGVTYNQFLENINSAAQPTYLRIGSNVYQNTDTEKITYVLNGNILQSISGVPIKSEDKLLINYGSETPEQIMAKYNQIQNKAATYNAKPDPASCSGAHNTTLQDRLNYILFQ